MTESTTRDRVLAILDRLEYRIPAVARETVIDDLPDVRGLPSEIRELELPSSARYYFALAIRLIRDGRPIAEEDLQAARERAARRAEDGVPLELVLHNWYHATQVFWQECRNEARPGDDGALVHIATALLALNEAQICSVAKAFIAEKAAMDSEKHGSQQLVARMMVGGQNARPDAERFGIELADEYDVLAVHLELNADEKTEQPTGRAVAGRRKLRRVARELAQWGSPPILPLLQADGGHLLVPRPAGATAVAYEPVKQLVQRLQSGAGVPVTAALSEGHGPESLPAQAMEASDVLELVRSLGRSPGLYRVSDVALAYQLTRPGAGRQGLEAMLTPLQPHPELMATLESYLRHDLDRGRTARALRVHPNTVNNRLSKVSELVGLDLGSSEGIITAGAAIAVRRASAAGTSIAGNM